MPASYWRVVLHAAVWAAVFAFWFLVTRSYHPNSIIGALVTALLVAAFAGAVYTNSYFLLPRYAAQGFWRRYLLSLLAVVVVLDLAVVIAIQGVYDLLWGLDPLRYGFWFNFATDGIGIVLHLVVGVVLVNVLGQRVLGWRI